MGVRALAGTGDRPYRHCMPLKEQAGDLQRSTVRQPDQAASVARTGRDCDGLILGRGLHEMLLDHRGVLQAQRLAGNAAVVKALRPVVQRTLTHAGFEADAGDQAKLDELTTLTAQYKTLCTGDQAEQASGLQARFQKLWSIDTKIHAWFTARQVPDLLAVKNGKEMKALLLETERERDVVVGKLIKAGAPVPMAGFGANENQPQLEALWTGIAAGTDNKLKVRGSDADRTQLLSRLAAIMQTPTGRAFLSFVSQHSPKAVELMFSDVAPAAEGGGSMPSAYAAKLTGAGAGERVSPPAGTELSKQDPSGLAAELATTARDFMVTNLLPAVVAKNAGTAPPTRTQQALGKPENAAAVVSRAKPLEKDREKLSTARGAEVLTPTFITLMHELGHALKIAVGGYLPDDATLMQHFIDGMPADQKKYWNMVTGNPNMLEELVNVLGIENPVRAESGLGSREIYQSTKEVSVQEAKDKAQDIMNRDDDNPADYMLDIIATIVSPAHMKLANASIKPEEVAAIHADLDTVSVAFQRSRKAAKAKALRGELDAFVTGKDGSLINYTKRYRKVRYAVDTAAEHPTFGAQITPLITDLAALKRDRDTLVKAGKVLKRGKSGAKVNEGGGEAEYFIPKKKTV